MRKVIWKWCPGDSLLDLWSVLVSILARFCDFVEIGGHSQNSVLACTGVIFS